MINFHPYLHYCRYIISNAKDKDISIQQKSFLFNLPQVPATSRQLTSDWLGLLISIIIGWRSFRVFRKDMMHLFSSNLTCGRAVIKEWYLMFNDKSNDKRRRKSFSTSQCSQYSMNPLALGVFLFISPLIFWVGGLQSSNTDKSSGKRCNKTRIRPNVHKNIKRHGTNLTAE